MKTLVLYSAYTDTASYFDDWVDAFKEHPSYDATVVNVFDEKTNFAELRKTVEKTELVVLHHSMNGDTLKYLLPLVSALKSRKGKLVSFVGNEVNLITIGMAPKIQILKDLETNIIATQLLQEAGDWLYADCKNSRVISLPHALNPKAFYSTNHYNIRKIDVGTRSARYGVYIGDNDRNNIIQFFDKISEKHGLCVDLGLQKNEQQRFTRQGWAQFLNSCKATLSTEAGSYYLERDDQLVKKIQIHLKNTSSKFVLPNDTFLRKLYHKIMPSSARTFLIFLLKNKIIESSNLDLETDFNIIYEKFIKNANRCPVYSKAISSRHFDAVGTKTLQVMYPGRYNDILFPGKHYFELKHDHSNIEDFIKILNDNKVAEEMIGGTYEYVMKNHTHKNRLDYLLNALG